MSDHGTTSRYHKGCRCARCRAANAEYQRAYQAKRRTPTPSYTAISTNSVSMLPPDQAARLLSAHWAAFGVAPCAPPPYARSPLEQLVDACIDLREAFAAYHQAHTEPLA